MVAPPSTDKVACPLHQPAGHPHIYRHGVKESRDAKKSFPEVLVLPVLAGLVAGPPTLEKLVRGCEQKAVCVSPHSYSQN